MVKKKKTGPHGWWEPGSRSAGSPEPPAPPPGRPPTGASTPPRSSMAPTATPPTPPSAPTPEGPLASAVIECQRCHGFFRDTPQSEICLRKWHCTPSTQTRSLRNRFLNKIVSFSGLWVFFLLKAGSKNLTHQIIFLFSSGTQSQIYRILYMQISTSKTAIF